MQVEQAVFASSDRGPIKGYQLVSKSAGVDRDLSQELCRWSPTQYAGDDGDSWTINSFPAGDDWVAVTRTVLGGPEYSSRGGSQVVTLILLLRQSQFESYRCNAVAVAKTALAMGYLRLSMDVERSDLPQPLLPDSPLIEPPSADPGCDQRNEWQILDQVSRLLSESRRVAVVGLSDPVDAVDRLVPRLPAHFRSRFSFTTGLAPAVRRPFRAHFLASVDSRMRRTLDSQDIVVLGPHDRAVTSSETLSTRPGRVRSRTRFESPNVPTSRLRP